MKKIFLLFLCAGMLVACHQNKSTYKAQVSDADKVLIKDEKLSLTKQDYW